MFAQLGAHWLINNQPKSPFTTQLRPSEINEELECWTICQLEQHCGARASKMRGLIYFYLFQGGLRFGLEAVSGTRLRLCGPSRDRQVMHALTKSAFPREKLFQKESDQQAFASHQIWGFDFDFEP